jgi:hypothetical protein
LIVTYSAVSGADFAYYKIYRKLSSASAWTYLGQTTSNVYVDKGLDPANSYDYKVTVVNDLGRESSGVESTDIISDTMAHNAKQQTTKPIIRQITPTNYYFNGTLTLETLVEDEIGLSKVTYEYRAAAAAETDPWQLITEVTGAFITQKSINLTPDYEGFEETLWSAPAVWNAAALSPAAYVVRVTVQNMGGVESVSIQTRTFNLVRSNTVEPVIAGISNPQTGGKLIVQLTLPATTEQNPTPMEYFTLYRSTTSGFAIGEATASPLRCEAIMWIRLGWSTAHLLLHRDFDGSGRNVSTQYSAQKAGTPTAESGLTIRSAADVKVSPDYPVTGGSIRSPHPSLMRAMPPLQER